MKKVWLGLSAVLLLAACGKEENLPENQQQLCQDSAVAVDVGNLVQKTMQTEAQHFAGQDRRQWVDADKLIAVAGMLQIDLSDAQSAADGLTCNAQVKISVPADVWARARTNSPLLGHDDPADSVAQRIIGSNMRFDGQTLSFPLNYAVQKNNGGTQINYQDTSADSSARVLLNALLPYGIKDVLIINGRTVSRDDALKMLQRPQPEQKLPENEEEAQRKAAAEEMANAREVDSLGAWIAQNGATDAKADKAGEGKTDNKTPPAAADKPDTLQPQEKEPTVSRSDLKEAANAHTEAGQAMRSAWNNIDTEIKKDLVAEQRGWEKQKDQSCRKAAAKAGDAAENRYLYMQCDTRMTRERVQYLRGYSIQ